MRIMDGIHDSLRRKLIDANHNTCCSLTRSPASLPFPPAGSCDGSVVIPWCITRHGSCYNFHLPVDSSNHGFEVVEEKSQT